MTEDDLDGLSSTDQDRILDKLDEIASSPWRDPPDYGEPLQNSPYKKIRVGEFRLSVSFRQDDGRLVVARIKRWGGAYTTDDDYTRETSCESGTTVRPPDTTFSHTLPSRFCPSVTA